MDNITATGSVVASRASKPVKLRSLMSEVEDLVDKLHVHRPKFASDPRYGVPIEMYEIEQLPEFFEAEEDES